MEIKQKAAMETPPETAFLYVQTAPKFCRMPATGSRSFLKLCFGNHSFLSSYCSLAGLVDCSRMFCVGFSHKEHISVMYC